MAPKAVVSLHGAPGQDRLWWRLMGLPQGSPSITDKHFHMFPTAPKLADALDKTQGSKVGDGCLLHPQQLQTLENLPSELHSKSV